MENGKSRREIGRAMRRFCTSRGMKGGVWGKMEDVGVGVIEGRGEIGWDARNEVSKENKNNEIEVNGSSGKYSGELEEDKVNLRPGWLPTDRSGNFVRSMLRRAEETDVNVVGVLSFVHEGDNTGDALRMGEVVREGLGLERKDWQWPRSWIRERPPPVGLY